jgi:hypothetical protein
VIFLIGIYQPVYKNGSADFGSYSGTGNEKNFIEEYEIVHLLSNNLVRVIERILQRVPISCAPQFKFCAP